MEAARDLGHLLEHGHEITFGLLEVRDRRPLAVRRTRADLLQVQVKREQVLLSAVVEISLEPTSRGVSSLDDACARGEQSARAVALATAVATSWVNWLSRISERSGIGSGRLENATIAPARHKLAARFCDEASLVSATGTDRPV